MKSSNKILLIIAIKTKLAVIITNPVTLMVNFWVALAIFVLSPPEEMYSKPPERNCQRVKIPPTTIISLTIALKKEPVLATSEGMPAGKDIVPTMSEAAYTGFEKIFRIVIFKKT